MRLPHRSSPFSALALPMTMSEDLARVRPTFMRRSSATKPMLRPTCVRTVLKIATSFSLPCNQSLTTHSWLTQSHSCKSLTHSALPSRTVTAKAYGACMCSEHGQSVSLSGQSLRQLEAHRQICCPSAKQCCHVTVIKPPFTCHDTADAVCA